MEMTMSQTFTWTAGPVTMTFAYGDDRPVAVQSVQMNDVKTRFDRTTPIAEIITTGDGHVPAGNRLTHTGIGLALRYRGHRATVEGTRHTLAVTLGDDVRGIEALVRYEVDERVAMVRTDVTVTNTGASPAAGGFRDQLEFGVRRTGGGRTRRTGVGSVRRPVRLAGRGSLVAPSGERPAAGHLPGAHGRGPAAGASGRLLGHVVHRHASAVGRAGIQDLRSAWLFQVEHNGAWRWDVEDDTVDGGIALSGPTNENHGWCRDLKPGESFTTVPASFTLAGDFDARGPPRDRLPPRHARPRTPTMP